VPSDIFAILISWISDRWSNGVDATASFERLLEYENQDQNRLAALGIIDPVAAVRQRLELLTLISWLNRAENSEKPLTRILIRPENIAKLLPDFWRLILPLALQLIDLQQQNKILNDKNQAAPLIQGIVGVQGAGKSTLAKTLQILIECLGCSCVAFSLDDLYKTYRDRLKLQKTDPRLAWRGVPGTHDVDLGINILQKLRRRQSVEIPRFDKSAFDGAGDRSGYQTIQPVDIVLFEGWFVGMRPLPEIQPFFANGADWQFAQDMNQALSAYLPMWELLDRLLVLYPHDYRWSLDWRKQAEQEMGASGNSAMTAEQIDQFVHYFWRALHPLCYFCYLFTQLNWVDLVATINCDRHFGAIYKLSVIGDYSVQLKNILIISSAPQEQEYFTELLSTFARVQVATEPMLAIAAIELSPFDMILLSVQFDRDQGYQFCEKLVSQHKIISPIIFICPPEKPFDLKRGLAFGAVDYLSYPWQDQQILHRLERCWSNWCLQEQVAESKTDLREMAIALSEAQAQFLKTEKLDYLTQIANRSYFYEQLEQEWRRLSREKEALAIVLFEVDYFRQFNALYGHQSGDNCLKKVAEVVCNILKRPADIVARFGDQEFALLLPKTDAGGAIHIARRIQKDLQSLDLPQGNISLSIGICSTIPNLNYQAEQFLQTGEQALFEAKDQGRDRIILKAFEVPNI
jgi:D-glycerate 3-kinase